MATAIDSTAIVAEALRFHSTTPVATLALGRLLTAASIMGNRLKEEDAGLTLRINSGGEIGSLIAVSDSDGNVKGYAQNPGLLINPAADGSLDIKTAIGCEGTLTVMREYGKGQPYAAQCPLAAGNISDDLTAYYAVSEQTPTVFLLDVSFDELWRFKSAGGVMISLLPAADEREIEKIEQSLASFPSVSELISAGVPLEGILEKALSKFELEYFDAEHTEYRCNCSRDRVVRALLTLGKDDIRTLADESGKAEVNCHFCDKKYYFEQNELDALADRL